MSWKKLFRSRKDESGDLVKKHWGEFLLLGVVAVGCVSYQGYLATRIESSYSIKDVTGDGISETVYVRRNCSKSVELSQELPDSEIIITGLEKRLNEDFEPYSCKKKS